MWQTSRVRLNQRYVKVFLNGVSKLFGLGLNSGTSLAASSSLLPELLRRLHRAAKVKIVQGGEEEEGERSEIHAGERCTAQQEPRRGLLFSVELKNSRRLSQVRDQVHVQVLLGQICQVDVEPRTPPSPPVPPNRSPHDRAQGPGKGTCAASATPATLPLTAC